MLEPRARHRVRWKAVQGVGGPKQLLPYLPQQQQQQPIASSEFQPPYEQYQQQQPQQQQQLWSMGSQPVTVTNRAYRAYNPYQAYQDRFSVPSSQVEMKEEEEVVDTEMTTGGFGLQRSHFEGLPGRPRRSGVGRRILSSGSSNGPVGYGLQKGDVIEVAQGDNGKTGKTGKT